MAYFPITKAVLRAGAYAIVCVLVCANTLTREEIWNERHQRVDTKLLRNPEVIQPYLTHMEEEIERMNVKVNKLRKDVHEMHRQRERMSRKARPRR